MTKHRTISQQQLHNDVRLVFPRNNCLLKLAALPLQMPTAQRAALPSFSSLCVCMCIRVRSSYRQYCVCQPALPMYACLCAYLCLCLRHCIRALCSIHSNVQREISFQYATRSATRRGLCLCLRLRLRLSRSRRRRVAVVAVGCGFVTNRFQ